MEMQEADAAAKNAIPEMGSCQAQDPCQEARCPDRLRFYLRLCSRHTTGGTAQNITAMTLRLERTHEITGSKQPAICRDSVALKDQPSAAFQRAQVCSNLKADRLDFDQPSSMSSNDQPAHSSRQMQSGPRLPLVH